MDTKTAKQLSDEKDIVISRRLQKVSRKILSLVRKELGEDMGFGLIIFPWSDTRGLEEDTLAAFQYVSCAPRKYMHGMLKELVAKWDSNESDTPPHLRQ